MIVYLEAENLTSCRKEKCFKNVVRSGFLLTPLSVQKKICQNSTVTFLNFVDSAVFKNLPDSFLIHIEHSSVTFKFQSKVGEGVIF